MAGRLEDRVLGCIVGGAIGDAMGGPYEGQPGPVALQPDAPCHLSDDTQLTLATCEAVCADGTVSPASIADRFLCWFRQGRVTGVGASTLKALRDLAAGAHWALSGRRGERGAGNGAAMRVAPLAFLLDPERPEQRMVLRDICRITHHNDEAYVGAVAVVVAVRAVASRKWQPGNNLPVQVAECLPDTMVKARLLAVSCLHPASGVWEAARQFGCSGYVAESVPLAIYAAGRIGRAGFWEVLQAAIAAGGDTDTIASMTGQIAGAWVGLRGIPPELVQRLPSREEVLGIARSFASIVVNAVRGDGLAPEAELG
jgi:ADP-ribosyl-[dinitrogen reductase] hydrolase